MALSGIKPFVHVSDSNGNPYVGAKLYVYLPTTTTLASIYSDAGLSVAISNPLTGANASDAAGNFPRFYLAAGTYKLRAETSAGVLIWEYDNIDTGLSAGSGALPIVSGGTGGTTATAARTNLDVPSNSELAALSAQIVTLQATLQNIVSVPQGRLTPTTAVPVISSTVTAGTSVYYTPYIGYLLPIYDGSLINTVQFSELTLTLNSNHTASNIYDVFIFKNSGSNVIGTGPAWNTSTAAAGARGTGAGTTELTRTIGGFWTNANAMTARNGATTYSVAVNQGTYVGSIYMDGTNGQITCHIGSGQSRKFGIWNAYNRKPIVLEVKDTTASWSPNLASTFRQSRADATNFATSFSGLPEEGTDIHFKQTMQAASAGKAQIGIGYNATNAATGTVGANTMGSSTNAPCDGVAVYRAPPTIGINNINCVEYNDNGAGTFYGNTNMLLSARWFG